MTLQGYSVPETLTDDAGNALKGVTVAVTGPSSYVGSAVTDTVSGVLRLGPLPIGDYTITLNGRSAVVPVLVAAADVVQLAGDLAGTAAAPTVPGLASKATTAALTTEQNRATAAEALAAQKSANLSDLASAATARTNLGLGSAATQPASAFDAAGAAAAKAPLLIPTTKTGAYTAAVGDLVAGDTTTAAFTVTLPSAPPVGAQVGVYKVDSTANVLTILPAGTGTIDGDPNAKCLTKNAGATLEHIGSDAWKVVSLYAAASAPGTLTASDASSTYVSKAGGAGGVIGGGSQLRTGYNSPGTGGLATLTVNGALAATVTNNEHRIQNSWGGNNTVAIQNVSTANDTYSATRFLDLNGREAMAVGYGNPATSIDYPFASAGYVEVSAQVNADGTADNTQVARPFRIVQTGVLAGTFGYWCRQEFTTGGQIDFFTLSGGGNNFSTRARVVRIEAGQAGRAPALGIGVGMKDNSGFLTPYGGAQDPAAPLDVTGFAVFGITADNTGSRAARAANAIAPINVLDQGALMLRLTHDQIGKTDIFYNATPNRLDFRDTDHSNVIPFSIGMDGSKNIGLVGSISYGSGSGVVAIGNAGTPPSTNPTGGGVLYVNNGALTYRGSSGTVTVLAAA